MSDEVFGELDNSVPPAQILVGQHSYVRSSSVSTSQTPILRRESTRRISEPFQYYPIPEKKKSYTKIVIIVVLAAAAGMAAGILFYRLEVKYNDLQRQLSELKAEYEVESKSRASTSGTDGAGDGGKCVCSSGKSDQQGNEMEDHKTDEENFRPDGSSQILQCCAQDSQQVKTMIEEAIREARESIVGGRTEGKDGTHTNSGHRRFAFAHVIGKKGTVQANNPMLGYMTSWIEEPQLLNRVKFRRGYIKIIHAGVYFVYSQIYFYQSSEENPTQLTNTTNSNHGEPMLHETCLNEQPIMKSAVPYRDFTSKYHGGVFKLERDDEISIRVSSNDYHVNVDPELTFFGVYSLEESSTPLPTTKSYTTKSAK